MTQQQRKVGILLELGEARRTPADWPDYKQYGFGEEDVEDLLEMLAQWGSCNRCAADLNDDGAVNTIDLLLLLGNWTACS